MNKKRHKYTHVSHTEQKMTLEKACLKIRYKWYPAFFRTTPHILPTLPILWEKSEPSLFLENFENSNLPPPSIFYKGEMGVCGGGAEGSPNYEKSPKIVRFNNLSTLVTNTRSQVFFGHFFSSLLKLPDYLNLKFRLTFNRGFTNHGYLHCAILKVLSGFSETRAHEARDISKYCKFLFQNIQNEILEVSKMIKNNLKFTKAACWIN